MLITSDFIYTLFEFNYVCVDYASDIIKEILQHFLKRAGLLKILLSIVAANLL